MPQYVIGNDILMTSGMTQSPAASNAVRSSLEVMLNLASKINIGDDIIKDINMLREQYDAKSAKKVINGLYKFDARLFFNIMDIISIKISENVDVYQNKLFADYIAKYEDPSVVHESDSEEDIETRPIFGGYVNPDDEDKSSETESSESTSNSEEV